jgi:hypothetical protein
MKFFLFLCLVLAVLPCAMAFGMAFMSSLHKSHTIPKYSPMTLFEKEHEYGNVTSRREFLKNTCLLDNTTCCK